MKGIVVALILSSLSCLAEENKNQPRRKYDLGAMQIDGKAVAPGDLTVVDSVDLVDMDIFERKNFKTEIIKKSELNLKTGD